jgi:nucleolar protein 56
MTLRHLAGIYDQSQAKPYTQEEAEGFLETVLKGERIELNSEDLAFLAKVQYSPLIREGNMLLTKMSIRASVKADHLIINTSAAVEEIDKVANTLVKRLREWYAGYDPEFEHAYKDHRAFVEAVLTRTTDRSEFTMGGKFTEADLGTIIKQTNAVKELYEQRDRLLEYLEQIMEQHTPNIRKVAGASIGAKLIALAGSLEKLSRMAASTVQLLGAETALFRHLRNKRARPPKHGIIFNHLLLQRQPKHLRGKAARALADKISIASKVDFFKGEYIGDKLLKEVEEKMRGAQ